MGLLKVVAFWLEQGRFERYCLLGRMGKAVLQVNFDVRIYLKFREVIVASGIALLTSENMKPSEVR